MGRPGKGRAAKAVVLSTKGTASERDRLTEMYGSVYVGMRVGLDMALGKTTPADAETSAPDGATATPAQDEPAQEVTPEAHRHRRGNIIDTGYANGSKTLVYACAVDGCTERLTS